MDTNNLFCDRDYRRFRFDILRRPCTSCLEIGRTTIFNEETGSRSCVSLPTVLSVVEVRMNYTPVVPVLPVAFKWHIECDYYVIMRQTVPWFVMM